MSYPGIIRVRRSAVPGYDLEIVPLAVDTVDYLHVSLVRDRENALIDAVRLTLAEVNLDFREIYLNAGIEEI